MLKKIAAAVAVFIALICVYAGVQSPDYKISRSIIIASSPERIFPYINSSKKMNDWMPWVAMDPQLKMTTRGPDDGVGSVSAWDSEGRMGQGQSTIIESIPNQSVKTKIDYYKPMKMTQESEMNLNPSAGGTLVSWSVTGKKGFMNRVVCIFMNMDKYVGLEFEKGLNNLKNVIENPTVN